MTKPVNTAAFAKATGKDWTAWLDFLEGIGAGEMSHAEIARRIVETGEANGWWAQGITVAYEQHTGRRIPGQRGDGAFEVSVSRTVPGSLDEVLARWSETADGLGDADGVPFAEAPETSTSEKWRYWRRTLSDGTRVKATIGEKGAGKAAIAVTHEKLDRPEDKDRWRAYWKGMLGAVG